jgi:DNA-binding NtrC family response regulator
MATILLLDSNINHRNSVALALRSRGHKVLTIANDKESLSTIDSRISEIDVVLAETINADELLWRQLEHICNLRRKDGLPPLIVSSSGV